MKNVSYQNRGWTITAKADRAPNRGRNISHGNNTLVGHVPGILEMSDGKGCMNPAGCGKCAHFAACKGLKGVDAATEYCQFRPTRFQWAQSVVSDTAGKEAGL